MLQLISVLSLSDQNQVFKDESNALEKMVAEINQLLHKVRDCEWSSLDVSNKISIKDYGCQVHHGKGEKI